MADVTSGNVFLKGNYVEVGIHPAGSFGTSVDAPAEFHPKGAGSNRLGFVADVGEDGWTVGTPNYIGDYFVPGTPEEGWCVEWTSAGGGEKTFGNFGLNNVFQIAQTSLTETSAGDIRSALWVGTATSGAESLQVTQSVHYNVNDLFFVISVTLVNTGTATINSVEYMRNVDPDQEQPWTSSYTTSNYVTNDDSTGQRLVVGKGLTYGSVCGLGTIDSRAVVSTEGFTNRDPDAILDSPVTPSASLPQNVDEAIALAYRFGSLAPGQSVSFDYAYILRESDLAVALGNLAAVTILQPTGTVSGNNVIFQATTDDIAGTTQVEFFVNGTSVGVDTSPDAGGIFETTFDSSGYANGTLNLKAVATFAVGGTVEKTSTVTVGNSGPPISFVAPLAGAAFYGSDIPVTINVLDSGHPPVSVNFFRETASTGSVSLGQDSSSPFGTTFSVTDLTPGEAVIIKAVAKDSLNRLTTIQVAGVAAPQKIVLRGNSLDIANGDTTPALEDHTNFGSAAVTGGSVVRTFTIANPGGAALQLTGTPLVALSGPGAASFSVTTQPASSTVAGGGTRTFQITFDPPAAGSQTATVSIASNDAGNDPYTFAIAGSGTTPQIAVEQPVGVANGIASGGSRDFGLVNLGASSAAKSFTLKNTGDGSLTLSAISKVGANAGDFTLTPPTTPLSLAPGESTTFDVAFAPTASGVRNASIRIESNDPNNGVFEVKLTGTGNALPALTLPGSPVTAEATSPAGAVVSLAVSALDTEDGAIPVTLSAAGITITPGSASLPPFATFPMGDTTVSASSMDSHGAMVSGSFIVRVRDTTAPVITVPGNISVEATGASGRTVSFNPSASDAVGVQSLTSTPPSGSLFAIGQTTVQVTAVDAAGNSASESFTVTVRDSTAPVITVPENITVEATSASGRVVTFNPSASDVVGVQTLTATPPSGSLFAIGQTTVQVTAVDAAGNSVSESFTVTVRDTTAPVITVPGNISVEATSASGRVVSFNPSASDVVGVQSLTATPPSGSLFTIGETTVQVTAVDAAGNSVSESFTVTVRDTTAPVITVPGNISVEATSASGRVVSFNPSASDVVGVQSLTATPPSGSLFTIGQTTVQVTAVDAAGNSASESFTVTVRDTTAPVLTVPDNITAEATSASGRVVTFNPTASDVVGVQSLTATPPSGSLFAIGETTVQVTAVDAAGNSASQSFTVTVRDSTAPVITVPDNITVEAISAPGRVVSFNPSASDVVGVQSLTSTPPSGSLFAIGQTTVQVTAVDAAGNSASESFTVTVRDSTAPVITVPENITVEATSASGRVVSFNPSASDVVGVQSLTATPPSGSLFAIGQTTVQVTAVDSAGNSATESFTVTVVDSTGPAVTAPSNRGPIEATGPGGAIVTYDAAEATDTVGVKSITYSRPSGSLFPLGTTTVTVTAVDNAGNTGTGSFTVTVQDTTPPVITPPANVSLPSTSDRGRIMTFTTGSALDLVDGLVAVTYSPNTGTEFPIGRTRVTVRAEDAAHNASTATFVVTITPNVDSSKPVLKLTSPASGTTGSPITIAGTVRDNFGLNYLRVTLNGQLLTLDTPLETPLSTDFPRNKDKAWSVSGVVPENGTNFLEVEAEDLKGLKSRITKTFTRWMNRPGLAGIYPALVKPQGVSSVANSGLVTLTVMNTGAFSGKVSINGADIPVMGVLRNDGVAQLRGTSAMTTQLPLITQERILLTQNGRVTVRTLVRNLGTLSLEVHEDRGVIGSLTNGAGPAPALLASFSGVKVPFSKTIPVGPSLLNLPVTAPTLGYYTVVMASGVPEDNGGEGQESGGAVSAALPPEPARPSGDGYATLTLNNTGTALLTGYLADGTLWTASAYLRSDGTMAVFSPLYGKKGGLAGEVKFDVEEADSDVSGKGFLWIRPEQPTSLQYAAGWPSGVYLDAVGSKFTGGPGALNVGQGPVNTVLGNTRLIFTDGLLSAPVLVMANMDAATGEVTKASETTFDYTIQVSSSTGVITGTFRHTDGAMVGYRGVILGKGANRAGFGYFLSRGSGGEGGGFTLEALPRE